MLDRPARMGETLHRFDAAARGERDRRRHRPGRGAHPPRPDRLSRIGLQAALRLADRHGAREVRPSPGRPRAAPLRGAGRHPRAAGGAAALRLGRPTWRRASPSPCSRTTSPSRSSPAASSSSPARRSTTCTAPATRCTRTWTRCGPSPGSSASASTAWASGPTRRARRSRGCPRAATRSCAATCRRGAPSAST